MAEENEIPDTKSTATELPVPELVARIYAESTVTVRSKMIAGLLGALGPLALACLADGRFARFLFLSPAKSAAVTLEEASRVTQAQILELASYAWQASPAIVLRVTEMLQSQDPMFARSLAGGLLVLAINSWMNRKRA